MRRLQFSRLLLLIALIPVVAMALFAGRLTYESWLRYNDLAQANSLLRLAVATSRFAGIAIPGQGAAMREYFVNSDAAKLSTARNKTDTLYRAVRDAAAANVVKDDRLTTILNLLDQNFQRLVTLRAKVNDRTLSAAEALGFLVPVSSTGNDLVGYASAIASDAILSRRIFALYATLQFNENTLILRSLVQRALDEGQLPPPAFVMLAKAVALQGTFGKLFRDYAPPDVVDQYNAFSDQHGKTIEQLQTTALTNSGKPAGAAEKKQWSDIIVGQTVLFGQLVSTSADRISAESESLLSAAWREIAIYFVITLIVLAAVVMITLLVLRTVRGLLGGLSHSMDDMREGRYDIAIPSVERKDEIGVMARATEGFRTNLVRMRTMETEQRQAEVRAAAEKKAAEEREAAQQRAAEEKAAAERKAAMRELARQFEAAVGQIVDTVSSASTELEAAAGTLTKTAETTQQLSTVVASASEQASANVQSVASATEEMTSSVLEISRQVQESSKIAGEAVKQAHETDARINELSLAASRIGDVVKLITAIAEQTNLLALNATIEAARAGASGKGFAVVASEVKALAAQTAKATDEIGTQISGMQAATQESVKAIKEIGSTIGRISEIAATIAAAVEEQGAATQEISRNVQEAAKGTAEVATNIVSVNHGAGETGSASSQVLSSARSLSTESSHLKVEVQKFLETVRAA